MKCPKTNGLSSYSSRPSSRSVDHPMITYLTELIYLGSNEVKLQYIGQSLQHVIREPGCQYSVPPHKKYSCLEVVVFEASHPEDEEWIRQKDGNGVPKSNQSVLVVAVVEVAHTEHDQIDGCKHQHTIAVLLGKDACHSANPIGEPLDNGHT